MEYKDYYKVLGVARAAAEKEIKSAYRKLARQHHPDQNPGNRASEEKFKEINEAYQVLSDPARKARYDQLGPEGWRHFGGRAAQAPYGPGGTRGQTAGGRGFDVGDFSEFFRTIFGDLGAFRNVESPENARDGFGRRGIFNYGRAADLPGEDVELQLEIPLEEAVLGTDKTLNLRIGSRTRRLDVKIPPGVRDGTKLRIAGEGHEGAGRGARGDVLFVIKLLPHPLFELRGDDLVADAPVPVWLAALGGEIEVPTIRGRVTMKIPSGTEAGQTFRLRGQGMPGVKGAAPGDQLVRVHLTLPRDLTDPERELLRELGRLRGAKV